MVFEDSAQTPSVFICCIWRIPRIIYLVRENAYTFFSRIYVARNSGGDLEIRFLVELGKGILGTRLIGVGHT